MPRRAFSLGDGADALGQGSDNHRPRYGAPRPHADVLEATITHHSVEPRGGATKDPRRFGKVEQRFVAERVSKRLFGLKANEMVLFFGLGHERIGLIVRG